MLRHTVLIAAVAVCAAGICGAVSAQTYPSKPIRIIVPFPAGGTSDILTRLIGAKLTEAWGQQVLPDNRPGANGNIGADVVARAAPDAYTLVLMDVGNLAISPSLFVKLPFDILRDFAPVTDRLVFTAHPRVSSEHAGTHCEGSHRNWPNRVPESLITPPALAAHRILRD